MGVIYLTVKNAGQEVYGVLRNERAKYKLCINFPSLPLPLGVNELKAH